MGILGAQLWASVRVTHHRPVVVRVCARRAGGAASSLEQPFETSLAEQAASIASGHRAMGEGALGGALTGAV
jgi:hypothetical protein